MTKKKRPRDPSRLATLDKLIRSRKDNDVILSEMVRHGYVNVTLKEVQNRRSLLKSRGEKFPVDKRAPAADTPIADVVSTPSKPAAKPEKRQRTRISREDDLRVENALLRQENKKLREVLAVLL